MGFLHDKQGIFHDFFQHTKPLKNAAINRFSLKLW